MKPIIRDPYPLRRHDQKPGISEELLSLVIVAAVPVVLVVVLLAAIRNYEGWLFKILERMGL